MKLYLIGSLRNPEIPKLGMVLRSNGHTVFEDWYSAGENADDYLWAYEQGRGHTYSQALDGYAAQHIFQFDKRHLDECEGAVLLLPAGKSGHLELGYIIGQGKPGFILLDKTPERLDVMYNFATAVCHTQGDLLNFIRGWEDGSAIFADRAVPEELRVR